MQSKPIKPPASIPVRRTSRRQWLKRIAAAGTACTAGVVVDTLWFEPHWLEIVERDLPIAGLPPQWAGKTLVQISDIHVGPQVSDEFILRAFQRVADLTPQIVVYTGDFITLDAGAAPWEQIKLVYPHLPRGTAGTIGVLGNHDYGLGWSNVDLANELASELAQCGLLILRNERIELDGLEIIGFDDLWSGRFQAIAPRRPARPAAAQLALCHNPDGADRAIWGGFQGWILAGHTHGGQCKPPFLPPPILPVRNRRYVAGEVDLFDGRKLYINRGLGHNLRVRFNARPEITVFRMVPAPGASV